MKNLILVCTIILSLFSSCKKDKQDKYTIVPQSASFRYKGPIPEPYALNYELTLKSIPSFVAFGNPVAYPDGHYEASVRTPFEINSGLAELVMADSTGKIFESVFFNIPLPDAGSDISTKTLSKLGERYNIDLVMKYSKIN